MISKMEPNGVESDPTIWNPHPMIDATHDPRRESFVESANHDPDFPIQNLPLGIFSPPGEAPRGGQHLAMADRAVIKKATKTKRFVAVFRQGMHAGRRRILARRVRGSNAGWVAGDLYD